MIHIKKIEKILERNELIESMKSVPSAVKEPIMVKNNCLYLCQTSLPHKIVKVTKIANIPK